MNLENTIATLLSGSGHAPDRLLQHLCSIQQQYSHIPPAAVTLLAEHLHLTPAQINGVIDFYTFLHHEARGDYDILFSDSITDRMLGNQPLIADLSRALQNWYRTAPRLMTGRLNSSSSKIISSVPTSCCRTR